MKRWENYHTHKYYTNIAIPDCPVDYNQYIERAIELNQRVVTSVEHGYQGNYWLLNELIENKNKEFEKRRNNGEVDVPEDLVFVFGTEAYWVKDRHEKDNTRSHIVILAKNENGRKKINLALSHANEDGMFGGIPRLDLDLILSLPKDDVFITSACLAYWKYEDIDDITLKLHNYFGDNFLLELQYHDTDIQREINRHALELCYKHNINYIVGCDTHVIEVEKDTKRREQILKYKGITYPEEEGWYIDYPDYDTIVERFKKQGILNDKEIEKALENTNIISTFGGYNLNRDIKLPSLYKNYTQEQKDNLFKSIINKEWGIFKDKENIPKEEYPMYLEGIRYEVNEVIKSGMTDYFLIHYEGLKRGVEKGGIITKRGRGCFTEDALVHTSKTMKSIKDVQVGDMVITRDGKFNKVLNTMKYDIEEELIQIKHLYGMDKYNPAKCTLDHRIYVKRNGELQWIKARNLTKRDYVCVPKIKQTEYISSRIDLNDYNVFGFKYDDEYIYEDECGKINRYIKIDTYFNSFIGQILSGAFKVGSCAKVFNNFIEKEFISFNKKGEFNPKWLNQPKKNLEAFMDGLNIHSRCCDENTRTLNFKDTPIYLINTYKILALMTGKGIYNLHQIDLKSKNVKEDDDYYYLPITEIVRSPKQKVSVYDIEVENENNYLLNNMIVHNSAVGFFINTLLGFSKVDRFKSPIKIYPERFLTSDRILKSKSLPD